MNWIKKILMVVAVATLFASPAMGQFRFGVKAGLAINDMKFNTDALKADNQKGFTGGLVSEFTMPVIGIGVDASLLYARRSFEAVGATGNTTDNRDYLDIPVNLKWKIGIPGVGKIVTPYITTGPDFSFLLSKKNISNAWENKTVDIAWTVGAGVQLFDKVQVGATYGWGLSDAASTESGNEHGALYSSKNRCWTVTAAYFF